MYLPVSVGNIIQHSAMQVIARRGRAMLRAGCRCCVISSLGLASSTPMHFSRATHSTRVSFRASNRASHDDLSHSLSHAHSRVSRQRRYIVAKSPITVSLILFVSKRHEGVKTSGLYEFSDSLNADLSTGCRRRITYGLSVPRKRLSSRPRNTRENIFMILSVIYIIRDVKCHCKIF